MTKSVINLYILQKVHTMKKTFFFVLLLLGMSQLSYSQNFRAQQKSQEKSIKAAYKKGRVTHIEYEKLMKEQYAIKEAMDKYYADGYLEAAEKNRLHDKLERAERRLRRYKHNGEIY